MRPRELPERKHVHRWRLARRAFLTVQRRCEDCGRNERAIVRYGQLWADPDVQAIADLDWTEGTVAKPTKPWVW